MRMMTCIWRAVMLWMAAHSALFLWPSDGGILARPGLTPALVAAASTSRSESLGRDARSAEAPYIFTPVDWNDVDIRSGLGRKLLHGCHVRRCVLTSFSLFSRIVCGRGPWVL